MGVPGLLRYAIFDSFLFPCDFVDHQHRHLTMHFTDGKGGGTKEGGGGDTKESLTGIHGVTEDSRAAVRLNRVVVFSISQARTMF